MEEPLAADMLYGVKAIADFLGESERRTHYLLTNRDLPAFRLRGRWCMRRSACRAYIARLEKAFWAKGVEAAGLEEAV